jgi:hypothetical protein
MDRPLPPPDIGAALRRGGVIPAHPLALDRAGRFDERRQRALTRYYLDAGSAGIALGVHTTQFAIRSPKVGLHRPVLTLGSETIRRWAPGRPVVRIAGVVGPTRPAVREAELARSLGFHVALLSLGGRSTWSERRLLAHAGEVARVLPIMGFYLQPAVGGRLLSYRFWRGLAELDNLVAIKIAPFNRYQTLDVVRAVADAGRLGEVALYTGNDDAIVADLTTPLRLKSPNGRSITARFVGGLLGHWAFWTRRAVELMEQCRRLASTRSVPASILDRAGPTTDANAAVFDAAHGFRGCIPGINEILRRQGLLASRRCLDPAEELSPGQAREITRVTRAYPFLGDDEFVAERLDRWLS